MQTTLDPVLAAARERGRAWAQTTDLDQLAALVAEGEAFLAEYEAALVERYGELAPRHQMTLGVGRWFLEAADDEAQQRGAGLVAA